MIIDSSPERREAFTSYTSNRRRGIWASVVFAPYRRFANSRHIRLLRCNWRLWLEIEQQKHCGNLWGSGSSRSVGCWSRGSVEDRNLTAHVSTLARLL